MKSIFLCLPFSLMITVNSYSQIAQKKEMQKAKTDTTKTMASNTVLTQNIVKTSPATNTSKQASMETQKINSVVRTSPIETRKNDIAVVKENKVPIPPDLSKASLLDAFFTLQTDLAPVDFTFHSYNKDPDTHWSCGIFDQDDKPVTSFHDDSNTDEYPDGSLTGPLKMHIDNNAIFGNFSNGGKLHINIAPNGNDEWRIKQFTLTIDFSNPKLTQKITWQDITLTQDKRDIDLYFMYDGKNLVPRQ